MNGLAHGSELPQTQITGAPPTRQRIGLAPQANGNETTSAARERLTRLLRRLRENDLMLRMMVSGFRALQRLGITVTPNHFHWPVRDIRDLESRAWPDNSVPWKVPPTPPACPYQRALLYGPPALAAMREDAARASNGRTPVY